MQIITQCTGQQTTMQGKQHCPLGGGRPGRAQQLLLVLIFDQESFKTHLFRCSIVCKYTSACCIMENVKEDEFVALMDAAAVCFVSTRQVSMYLGTNVP